MNEAQWLFEYYALQQKEQQTGEIFKAATDTLRNMLIALLGLKPVAENDAGIVPLSLMCGNHHFLPGIIKDLQAEADGKAAADDDADFDALSEQIRQAAVGEGDAIPILAADLDTTNLYARSDEYQQALASLGIGPRTTPEEALRQPRVLVAD